MAWLMEVTRNKTTNPRSFIRYLPESGFSPRFQGGDPVLTVLSAVKLRDRQTPGRTSCSPGRYLTDGLMNPPLVLATGERPLRENSKVKCDRPLLAVRASSANGSCRP